MAKQKGFINLEGTLGGLTFYKSEGESFVKTAGGISKDRILKEARFKRTRENMSEFGGAANVGKALRHGLASIVKIMSDSRVAARLTGIMKKINSLGLGARGQRSFNILPNKELLQNFEFNKDLAFETIFYAPFDAPTLDVNRSITTWTIPDFNTANYISQPEGASHFKLVLATTVLSDFTYNNALKGYEPTDPDENEVNAIEFTPQIPLGADVGAVTTLTTDLGFAAPLPASVAVVVCLGIIFYQEINGAYYELASDNAMYIDTIG